MKKFILSLDFLGTSPFFLIEQQRSNRSLLGGFISAVVFLILLAGSSYFLTNLVTRSSFSVISTQKYNTESTSLLDYPEYSLTLIGTPFEEIQNSDRIYHISSNYFTRSTDQNNEIIWKNGSIELERCNLSNHFVKNHELWQGVKLMNESVCIESIKSTDDNRRLLHAELNFLIFRCVNSTQKNNCLPIDDIDSKLNSTMVYFRFTDYYYDNFLADKNMVPFVQEKFFSLSLKGMSHAWYTFEDVEYSNENGLIFSHRTTYLEKSLKSFQLETVHNYNYNYNFNNNYQQQLLHHQDGLLAVISLTKDPLKKIVSKRFYKIQEMLADIGGLIKAVTLCAGILNYFYSEKLYYQYLINSNMQSLITNPHDNEKLFSQNIFSSFSGTPNQNPGSKIHILFNSSAIKDKFKIPSLNFKYVLNARKDSNVPGSPEKNIEDIKKKMLVHLKFKEMFLPALCFCKNTKSRDNVDIYINFKKIIDSQMEIAEIMKTLNKIDKISYALLDEKKRTTLDNCVNPLLINDNERANLPECQMLRELMKNEIKIT